MLERPSRSLSFRLLAIFILLAALFVYGTLTAIKWVYNSDAIRGLISGHLSLHVQYVLDDIGNPPRIDRAINITERVPVDIRILGPDIDWASDEQFPRLESLDFGPSPKFSDDPDAWVDELEGVKFAESGHHNFLRMQQGDYAIVVVSPKISSATSGPDLVMIIVGLGLLYLALGYLAVRWLFKPISAIRSGAAEIGKGNFRQRIRDIRKDELGDLAADINTLAGNVEHMLDAKRALLLGISHELRTPMSRMRIGLEFLDDREQAETLREELAEMEQIVATLLEAEHLAVRHEALVRAETDVDVLVAQLLQDFFARDTGRIRIENRVPGVVAEIDAHRVALMLKNLISNALHHGDDDALEVVVTIDTDHNGVVFRVCDNGPGMSAEDALHIGEPFFRGDPSRTRETGGTGLGLYLASLVASAHGGSLRLANPDARGACFEVTIPAKTR